MSDVTLIDPNPGPDYTNNNFDPTVYGNSNINLQRLVELNYVTTGNELISANLTSMEGALSAMQGVLTTLANVQNLKNQITIPSTGVFNPELQLGSTVISLGSVSFTYYTDKDGNIVDITPTTLLGTSVNPLNPTDSGIAQQAGTTYYITTNNQTILTSDQQAQDYVTSTGQIVNISQTQGINPPYQLVGQYTDPTITNTDGTHRIGVKQAYVAVASTGDTVVGVNAPPQQYVTSHQYVAKYTLDAVSTPQPGQTVVYMHSGGNVRVPTNVGVPLLHVSQNQLTGMVQSAVTTALKQALVNGTLQTSTGQTIPADVLAYYGFGQSIGAFSSANINGVHGTGTFHLPTDYTPAYRKAASTYFGRPIAPMVGGSLFNITTTTTDIRGSIIQVQSYTATQDAVNTFAKYRSQIQAEYTTLRATAGPTADVVTALSTVLAEFPNVSNGGSVTDATPLISKWLIDSYGGSTNATTAGKLQTDITTAITATQNLNTTQQEKVKNYMFLFQEFYQSASSMLTAINQMITQMAQNINR